MSSPLSHQHQAITIALYEARSEDITFVVESLKTRLNSLLGSNKRQSQISLTTLHLDDMATMNRNLNGVGGLISSQKMMFQLWNGS